MFLGIDIGTTGVKSVLIDDGQTIIGTAHVGLPLSRPRPGWSEQDPADWWKATTDTLDELWSAHLEAIGAFLAVSRFAALARGAALIAFSQRPERGDLIAMGDAVARFTRIAGRIIGLTSPAADPAFEPPHRRPRCGATLTSTSSTTADRSNSICAQVLDLASERAAA